MKDIFELLSIKTCKISLLEELENQIVKQKRDIDSFECDLRLNTDFKAIGATNEKKQTAFVKKQIIATFPTTLQEYQNEAKKIERQIDNLTQIIDVMEKFGVREIEYKED